MKRLNYSTTSLLGLTVYRAQPHKRCFCTANETITAADNANWSLGTVDVNRGVWETCLRVKSEILKITHSGPF